MKLTMGLWIHSSLLVFAGICAFLAEWVADEVVMWQPKVAFQQVHWGLFADRPWWFAVNVVGAFVFSAWWVLGAPRIRNHRVRCAISLVGLGCLLCAPVAYAKPLPFLIGVMGVVLTVEARFARVRAVRLSAVLLVNAVLGCVLVHVVCTGGMTWTQAYPTILEQSWATRVGAFATGRDHLPTLLGLVSLVAAMAFAIRYPGRWWATIGASIACLGIVFAVCWGHLQIHDPLIARMSPSLLYRLGYSDEITTGIVYEPLALAVVGPTVVHAWALIRYESATGPSFASPVGRVDQESTSHGGRVPSAR